MTYTNEQLGLALIVNDDGSYETRSTRPSYESRIFSDAGLQWIEETLERHFAPSGQ